MKLLCRALLVLALMATWGNSVSSSAGTSDGSSGVLRIVALGDSTTAPERDWAPEVNRVYADCLPGALSAHRIHAEVANAGIGGTTTRDAVLRLDRDVLSKRPDIVIVQFGINDSWIDVDTGATHPRLTQAEYRNNLRAIIEVLRQHRVRTLLMTPNPMRWGNSYYIKAFQQHPDLLDVNEVRGIDRLLDKYAEDVREVARIEHVALVDVFSAFEAYGRKPDRSVRDLLLADGIHPNQRGQEFVCSLLTARLLRPL
jgi:lysophospholipase L1-like esterase